MTALPKARTYNQTHLSRPSTGGRHVSIYWTWSYPWESQRDPAEVYHRFSTITEVRNLAWPAYETPDYDAARLLDNVTAFNFHPHLPHYALTAPESDDCESVGDSE